MDALLEPPGVDLPSARPARAVGELIHSSAAVLTDARVRGVADLFFSRPELEAVALLENGRPVGLLSRARLLLTLARGYGQELWARKPVARIADMAPLILTADCPLGDAIALALSRAAAAVYEHIVVRDAAGGYLGLVPVRQLVLEQTLAHARTNADHEAAVARAADLEKLDRLRSQFLAHATHELRSPVNAIAALAETIRLASARGDLPGIAERVALLQQSAAGLRTTINELLDLSRLEAGKVAVTCAPCAVGPLLDELATTARLLVGARPVVVRAEAAPGLELETDRGKLRQILLNLVSNAAKFTERGEIRLVATRGAGGLRFEVTDTGCGIAPEDLSRLFVPFGQLEDARVKVHEGTGLGLVLARSTAALLGGRIEVRSRRGAGSTFSLHLPHPTERSRAA